MDGKFNGAAAVGNRVIFAPYHADFAGVYDVITSTFDASIPTDTFGFFISSSMTPQKRFWGAAAVGDVVVFAPFYADYVGVYSVSTSTFYRTDLTAGVHVYHKFAGAAAVGNRVVFAPYVHTDSVGVYDVLIEMFSLAVSLPSIYRDGLLRAFNGAVAIDDLVVFVPYNAEDVGVSM
eukprot:7289800-Prymnesium_polylepis.1